MTNTMCCIRFRALQSVMRFVPSVIAALLSLGASSPQAMAQAMPSTTTLSANSTSGTTGSVIAMTATVLSGGVPVKGGVVKFEDNYNGITSSLGAVQIRTANGTAILKSKLAGAGTHSLTATYSGDNTILSSTSLVQPITISGLFASSTTIASSGTLGDNTLVATVTGYGNGQLASNVNFNNVTTNQPLGTVALDPASLTSGFGAPQTFGKESTGWPHGLASGDFNGDGIPDIAVVFESYVPGGRATVDVLIGNGDGTFQPPVSYPAGANATAVAVADLNGDGVLDIIAANSDDNTISVLLGRGDGTFQTQITYSVGLQPDAIAIGDFNGDGIPDLAVANFGGDSISILLGKGDGTVSSPNNFVVGSNPMAVAVGDFNGDGRLDLVVGNVGDGSVGILLGRGDGTFLPQVTVPSVGLACDIAVGDFTGNGTLDLAIANSDYGWTDQLGPRSTIAVLLGNGDGTFKTPVAYTTVNRVSAITAADINKDGKLDLLAQGTSLSILLGRGDGTFTPQLVTGAAGTLVVDLNGDGLLDLASENGGVVVSLGKITESAILTNVFPSGSGSDNVVASYTGTGYFSPSTSSPIALTAGQIATTLSLSASAAAVGLGQPVTLTAILSPASVGTETTDGALIKFLDGTNSLGTSKLAGGIATFMASSLSQGTHPITAVFAGAAPFQPSSTLATTVVVEPVTATTLNVSPASGITAGIFTLTASVKLAGSPVSRGAVLFQDSFNGILRTLGTAQLQISNQNAVLKTTLAGPGKHVLTAVFDGLSAAGISASPGQTVTVAGFYQTATALAASGTEGDYTLTATLAAYGNATPTAIVSFDDITAGGTPVGTAQLSTATFRPSFIVPPITPGLGPGQSNAVAVGDFNGDGVLDVATGFIYGPSTNSIEIRLGNGDGTFTPQPKTSPVGVGPDAIAMGDFNGDGKLDLAAANGGNSLGAGSTISVLLSNGDGTFQPQKTYNVGVQPYAIAVGDLNGDGILDLAVANLEGDTVSILLGNGDGTFRPQVPYGVQTPTSIAIGDFNGDGKLDLAIASPQINEISVLLGNGDGTFQTAVEYPAGSVPTTVYAGDYNGDGKLDLIAGNENGASVLLGNGDGTFQPQVAYSEGIYYFAQDYDPISPLAVGDIDGDGKPDLIYVVGDPNSVVTNTQILVGYGNGDGTFQSPVSYSSVSVTPIAIALGDFNGDGRLDLAVADALATSNTEWGADVYLNALTATATLSGVAAPASGPQAVDAVYSGDANFSSSTSSTVNLIGSIPTLLTVSTSATNVAQGQTVTLTATLAPYAKGSLTTDQETITFLDGTKSLGTAKLVGGVATLPTSSLDFGENSITAVYAGDAAFNPSTSQAFALFVNGATTTTLTISPGSGGTGSIFKLNATVESSNNTPVLFGTVAFIDTYNGLTKTLGSTQMQSVNQVGVLKTALIGAGTHVITAAFLGIAGSAPSVSTAVTVVVNGLYPTGTALVSSGSSGDFTLSATINASGNASPSGNVTFIDSTVGFTLGTASLSGSSFVNGYAAALQSASVASPYFAVTGDFNNDGFSDVALISRQDSSSLIALQLGNGDGSFQSPRTLKLSYQVAQGGSYVTQPIVVGDFNGDGNLDLAVIGPTQLGILLGNGDGSFRPEVDYALNGTPQAIAVGDLNEDGKQDLVIFDGSIGVLLGNGDGTFQPEQNTANTAFNVTTTTGLVVGDFNGDGKLDVAIGSGEIYIALGNGNGTFQAPVGYPVGQAVNAASGQLAVADFNGDGKLDIVSYDGADFLVSVLLGKGDGTFASALSTAFGQNLQTPAKFAIGDFNNDGNLDLAAISNVNASGGTTVGFLFGNGDGTFISSSATYPAANGGATSIIAADFNTDGRTDLLLTDAKTTPGSINVVLGKEVGVATLAGISVPGSGTHSVSALYSGDTNFEASDSLLIALAASQIPTTLTLSASAPPSNNSSVTLLAILSPSSVGDLSDNGDIVTFLTGSSVLGSAQLTNGVAVWTTTSVPAGASNLIARFPGDANFAPSQSAQTSVVLKPMLLIAANSFSRTIGQANPVLTYSITGFVNGDTSATATSGMPMLTTMATPASSTGSYPITIALGTLVAPNYNITFINGTLTVVGKSQNVMFPSIANTVYSSTPITLSATATSGLPTTYSLSASSPAMLSGSSLILTGAGTVTVTASQVGNGIYAPATDVSQSFVVTPAVLTVTASSFSRTYGTANPTLTYLLTGFVGSDTQVATTTGAPAITTVGNQTSILGTYPITVGPGSLAAKSYTFTFINGTLTITGVSLTVSANSATRLYGTANPNFTGSVQGAVNGDTFTESFSTLATMTSSPGDYSVVPTVIGSNIADYTVQIASGLLTIAQAPTTVALSASGDTSGAGSAVTFTAQVASSTSGTPTGAVSFFNGTALLGTGILNTGGQATYSSNALPIGNYSVTAAYSGDINFTAGVSSPTTGTIVQSGTFAVGSSPTNQSVTAGSTATYNITISPTGGSLTGPLVLSVSGLPPSATAAFSPATLSAGVTSSILTIKTIAIQAGTRPGRVAPVSRLPLAALAAGLLMLPMFRVRTFRGTMRKRLGGLAISLCLALSLGGLAGCTGQGAPASIQSPEYTLTVTGTSGSFQQSTTVTLTVQ